MSRTIEKPNRTDGLLVIQYLRWMREVRNRTDATVNTYGVTLQSWVDWRHNGILTATQRDMERWVMRPRPRRGHGNCGAPATRKKDIAVLRSFYRWLVASGELTADPTLGLHGPTVHNILPKPVDDAVWHKVWNSLKLTDDERVFLGLGYFAGLRRQEITRLKRSHFTPERIVGMFVQFDYASNTSESELIQKGRDAFFVAKSVVFEQLGIDAILEESGIVVELVKQNFPGTTAEVVAGAPITPVDPVAADGTTVSADPPADKTALKAWALARFASHPQEFFDNRPKKAAGEYNPKSPDLKHKATGKGIWFS